MPTLQNVLTAFDSFGDAIVKSMTLKLELEKQGFDPGLVAIAINAAITSGKIIQTEMGGLRKA